MTWQRAPKLHVNPESVEIFGAYKNHSRYAVVPTAVAIPITRTVQEAIFSFLLYTRYNGLILIEA
tara:strand:+ start:202 stop:396 length:195 start_codon:yes stop_codon:yes gene_type:complete